VLSKHLGRMNRQRRIEKYRRSRDVAVFHQIDQVDNQFLGALDRKGGDQQHAFCRRCMDRTPGQALATFLRCRGCAYPVAVRCFANP
jgi:hypothetical protein